MHPQIDPTTVPAGTQVFGLRESHRGWRLNRLAHSLTEADGRAAYRADEPGCLDRFGLSADEKRLVLARDFPALLEAGANIFMLIKLAAACGVPIYRMGAQMRGEAYEDFLATREQRGAV